jgi:hypothetical protein
MPGWCADGSVRCYYRESGFSEIDVIRPVLWIRKWFGMGSRQAADTKAPTDTIVQSNRLPTSGAIAFVICVFNPHESDMRNR